MHEVERHYTHGQLERSILKALEGAGKILGDSVWMTWRRSMSFISAVSRRLASEYGCRVIGLDLTEEYSNVAEALGTRLGLQDLIPYGRGMRWRCRLMIRALMLFGHNTYR